MIRTKSHPASAGTRLAIAAVAASVFALCAAANPPEPPRYVLNPLGTLGGAFSRALGMNETGAVVGWSTTAADPTDRPQGFLWKDGVMDALPTLGGPWTEARDVNDREQIVGVAMVGPGGDHAMSERHGVLWYDGVIFDLNDVIVTMPTTGQPGSIVGAPQACNAALRLMIEANAINDDGTIVGCGLVYSDDEVHGILLIPTEPFFPTDPAYDWIDLGRLKGATDCFAYGINDAGHVVGASGERAFVNDGETRQLELFAPESEALGINNHGTVVGWSGENDMVPAACRWEDGHRFGLGAPSGWISAALAVGDNGLIVGWMAETQGHPQLAMMWEGCIPVDLSVVTAIPLSERGVWTLEIATAIDTEGRIAGFGRVDGVPQAFLLVPIASTLPSPH